MVPAEKLDQIKGRFQFLEARLSAGADAGDIAALSREYSDLKPVVAQIDAYRAILKDMSEAEAMLADPEMRALACRAGQRRGSGRHRVQGGPA